MPLASDAQLALQALDRVVGVLAEDAIFVLATVAREPRDALEGLLPRRASAYSAAVQGLAYSRMTHKFDPWFVEMVRAMAPVSPPAWVPMMEMVREKVTLEIGARGLRSLFSNRPSERETARVKRYGSLGVRVLRAVFAADGSLDGEERMIVSAAIASLGLPDADANALSGEPPVRPDALEAPADGDPVVSRAIVRGAWLAAAWDALDPREEHAIQVAAQKMGVPAEEVEAGRRDAIERIEGRRRAGAAAVDGVRYLLSDRIPGLGVQLAALTGTLMLPRRWREEVLAGVGQGAPVALARRHADLRADERTAVLGIAWAAALADSPSVGRRALLRARWERLSQDLGEDDPAGRELVEHWIDEGLAGIARTLP
jgi:hypothetical protein